MDAVLRCGIASRSQRARSRLLFSWLLRGFLAIGREKREKERSGIRFDDCSAVPRVYRVAMLEEVSSLLSRCKSRICGLLMEHPTGMRA